MTTRFLIVLFLVLSGTASAQDTILLRSGQVIPAVIVERNSVELKYKRFGQPEPAAIYSVFISDIARIHYADGMVADYTQRGEDPSAGQTVRAIDLAGTMKSIKLSLGASGGVFNRNKSDELLLFWQNLTGDPGAQVYGNPVYYPMHFRMTFFPGKSGRNWAGDELQLIFTPSDAINAKNSDGSSEIQLKAFYYNIILFYGHTLNHKRTIAAIVEPGLDLAFMSGHIKLNNTMYNISGNLGAGFHLALGTDWIISRRIMASARAGYRFNSFEESHKSSSSSSGYASFYVNPGVSTDLLTIKWNGPYASLGLSWSFYGKLKFGAPE